MTPYETLGIASNSTVAEAKVAWRKLARKHHPDVGGSEEKFKEAKSAWEAIESGKVQPTAKPVPTPAPTTSSFTQGLQPQSKPYTAPTRIQMPQTVSIKGKHSSFPLDISVTMAQAERGCAVPFIHAGVVHDYMVQPGSRPRTHAAKMTLDNTIGKFPPDTVDLIVNLYING